ncbi:MAG: ABC transporter permease [Elusimicrobia bacterium]|nr:ABC transporter permease [Elusimicrobiota bacterium]
MTALLDVAGSWFLELAETLGRGAMLVRSTAFWLFRARIEWRQTLIQMVRIGVDSFPVTAATSLFTGMVLALETGSSFRSLFNEPLFTGTIVSFAIVKELGPVMTALVVAGRAGASVAAEIGTMQVTEQIDALYTLGTDPVRYLVIPRVLAFILVLPFLVVISDFSGILGGYLVARVKYQIPPSVFWHDIIDTMRVRHFMHGYIKAYVFAVAVSLICCYKGVTARGGAEGVGKSTTQAVVLSMVAIFVLDYLATAVLVALGIT